MTWTIFALGLLLMAGASMLLVKCANEFVHCLKLRDHDWAVSAGILVLACIAIAGIGLYLVGMQWRN